LTRRDYLAAAVGLDDGRAVGELPALDRRVDRLEVPFLIHHEPLEVGVDRHVRHGEVVDSAAAEAGTATQAGDRCGARAGEVVPPGQRPHLSLVSCHRPQVGLPEG